MVVERAYRLAMQDPVMGKVAIGGDGAPSGDLEVDPVLGLSEDVVVVRCERRGESPGRAGRAVDLPNVGQLHRRIGDVGSMSASVGHHPIGGHQSVIRGMHP